jgi:hypothetical protein
MKYSNFGNSMSKDSLYPFEALNSIGEKLKSEAFRIIKVHLFIN